jgi:tRNA nucleotidyltransferase (CCA-adding enzyme)
MDKIIYNVLNTLNDNGYEAYLIGGYVRSYLLKDRSFVFDIDICTNATVKELVPLFSEYDIKTLDYGNVLFYIGDYKFEITTFRKELNYKNNRKPVEIVYIDNLRDDLLRRDFTINSICLDKDNNVIDLLDGKKDLKKRVIRTIGNANERLNEDALRILRAIRFATVLRFKLDSDLKGAIVENKELLRGLSYERKKEELTKIFASDNKKIGVRLLKELGLLDVLELKNIDNVLLTKDLIAMWATITDAYPLTKTEKNLSVAINGILKEDLSDDMVLYRYGLYPLMVACDLKKLNRKKMNVRYESLPIRDRNEINITTNEICCVLGKEPDSFLKDVFSDLEVKILKGKLINENGVLREYVYNKYL